MPTGEVVSLLFDNLTQFDADARLVPGLARAWETDAAGRVYTFHLRQGATFHDGRPITARDVRASFLRALAPGSTGGRSWPLYPILGARAFADGKNKEVEGLNIPNDSTVVLRLEEPLECLSSFSPCRWHAIIPTPTAFLDFDQHPVGQGPWKFVPGPMMTPSSCPRTSAIGVHRPASDTLKIRIDSRAAHPVAAEYEAGQLERG